MEVKIRPKTDELVKELQSNGVPYEQYYDVVITLQDNGTDIKESLHDNLTLWGETFHEMHMFKNYTMKVHPELPYAVFFESPHSSKFSYWYTYFTDYIEMFALHINMRAYYVVPVTEYKCLVMGYPEKAPSVSNYRYKKLKTTFYHSLQNIWDDYFKKRQEPLTIKGKVYFETIILNDPERINTQEFMPTVIITDIDTLLTKGDRPHKWKNSKKE